jgi:N-acetylglutamate synthase-like GNAT family acetyltransferase
MAARVRKIRRHRDDGELAVEQTHDVARVAEMLEAAGLSTTGLYRPGNSFLIAYLGATPVGLAGVETRIDVAAIRALAVVAEMRRRGIGAALAAAARAAAHARGARTLYALAPDDGGQYFKRLGFKAAVLTDAIEALDGTFVADNLRTIPDRIQDLTAWSLDISRDGIVMR